MSPAGITPGETLATLKTSVRLFSRVNPYVARHIPCDHFATPRAFFPVLLLVVRFLPFLHCLHPLFVSPLIVSVVCSGISECLGQAPTAKLTKQLSASGGFGDFPGSRLGLSLVGFAVGVL